MQDTPDSSGDKLTVSEAVVVMRDGTGLATRSYRYYQNHRLPALLIRTPYDINTLSELARNQAQNFDLCVITQDMRGRFQSGGTDTVFWDDWRDGCDTISWIKCEDPGDNNWWNGLVGSWGPSALAINQYTYAGEDIPELVAQYLSFGTPEQYDHMFFQGGQLRYNLLVLWSEAQGDETYRYLQDVINSHPRKNSWWAKRSLAMGNRYASVHAAAVHMGGWDDPFSEGTIAGFMGYNHRGGPGARGHQILIMAGAGHGAPVGEIEWPGAYDLPAGNLEDFLFKTELHQVHGPRGSSGYEDAWNAQPKVYYYIYSDPDYHGKDPRACTWQTAADWPPPASSERWYLQTAGDQWSGVLSQTPPQTASRVSYIYDPASPCPTNGGNNLFATGPDETPIGQGCTDQRGHGPSGAPGITHRDDVVSFTSDEFTGHYEFAGNIRATLFVQSTAPDTDFAAKLIDVFPDGREMLITGGILRACRMNGFDTTTWMDRGQTYRISIDLWSKAWRFQPGHRLKLLVTSSNYPRFQRNPNLKQEIIPVEFNRSQTAENTILMGPDLASHIELPVTQKY